LPDAKLDFKNGPVNLLRDLACKYIKIKEEDINMILGAFVSSCYDTVIGNKPSEDDKDDIIMPTYERTSQTIGDLNESCYFWAQREVERRHISIRESMVTHHDKYFPFDFGISLFKNYRAPKSRHVVTNSPTGPIP